MQGLWGRSVAAQSTALRTEIWRGPNNSDQHCQEKKKQEGNQDGQKAHLVLMGSGDGPWPGKYEDAWAQKPPCWGTGTLLRREGFPNAQLLPFSGKKGYTNRSLAESIVTTQQETPQTMYELLPFPQVLPFLQGCMLLYVFPVAAAGCRPLAGESTD